MKTVIKYNKKRLYTNLFIGLAWLVLFTLGLVANFENIEWYYYFHLILSLIYIGQYFYENRYQYLIIANDSITKPNIFDTQKIKISEITHIKKFAGDITICSNKVEIGIAKSIVEPESFKQLEGFLDSYGTQKNT